MTVGKYIGENLQSFHTQLYNIYNNKCSVESDPVAILPLYEKIIMIGLV